MKTQGLSPKVPVQAITTVLVGALAYFGVDLDPELSGAIAVILGFVAGYWAPAAPVALKDQNAQGLLEVIIALLVILILIVLLFRLV